MIIYPQSNNSNKGVLVVILAEAKPHIKDFYFTTGQRCSIKLVYGGFQFVKFMENSKGTKWICATRSSTKCRARLRTKNANNELEILCPVHNHEATKIRGKLKPKLEK